MFDFAWSELALIAVVALVVIGPKDLPRVLRTTGQWVRKARAIAREFQSSLDQMVREAELDDVKRDIDSATRFDFEKEFTKTVDPQGELQRSLSEPVLTNPMTDPPKPAAAADEPLPSPVEAKSEAVPEAAPSEPGKAP
jgi:sec-independent protein translocase protein TatB